MNEFYLTEKDARIAELEAKLDYLREKEVVWDDEARLTVAENERLRAAMDGLENELRFAASFVKIRGNRAMSSRLLDHAHRLRALTEGEYGRKVFNPDTGEWDDTGERSPHPVTLEDAEAEYHAEGER